MDANGPLVVARLDDNERRRSSDAKHNTNGVRGRELVRCAHGRRRAYAAARALRAAASLQRRAGGRAVDARPNSRSASVPRRGGGGLARRIGRSRRERDAPLVAPICDKFVERALVDKTNGDLISLKNILSSFRITNLVECKFAFTPAFVGKTTRYKNAYTRANAHFGRLRANAKSAQFIRF